MAGADILTAGAIPYISSNSRVWSMSNQPVVQITNIRRHVDPLLGFEKYELTLSDGSFYQQASLPSTYVPFLKSQQLQIRSIIKLTYSDFIRYAHTCPIIIRTLEVILVNYPDIIGNPKPFPIPCSMQLQGKQKRMLEELQLRNTSMLFTTNESVTRPNKPKINTVKEESEEFPKGPNSKKMKTSQSSSEKSDFKEEKPSINDHGKTPIELIDLEQDIEKPFASHNKIDKRGPTIDECADKLKGLDLKATDPLYLAAFCIFSQPDMSRESWMKLPSETEVLKGWIKMMAKMKGIMN